MWDTDNILDQLEGVGPKGVLEFNSKKRYLDKEYNETVYISLSSRNSVLFETSIIKAHLDITALVKYNLQKQNELIKNAIAVISVLDSTLLLSNNLRESISKGKLKEGTVLELREGIEGLEPVIYGKVRYFVQTVRSYLSLQNAMKVRM